MNNLKDYNAQIEVQNQNNLRELEVDYINDKIAQLPMYLEEKKKEITDELIKFKEEHTIPFAWDKAGEPTSYGVELKPLVIQNYFFKSINPISSAIPEYNAEKLGLVFDYYNYILTEINDKIGNYPSSLITFCKLAGISTSTLRQYKNSADINMRNVVEKIYDQVSDENVTLSQMGRVKERSTIFKMKSQNDVTETVTPNVNINYTEIVDTTKVNDRINKYKSFIDKKNKGKIIDEQ